MPEGRIIVTGASKGIGAAIAVELDRRGYDIVGLSRSGDTPVGRGMVCDMTDEASVRTAIAAIAAEGPIAGLVNNAGVHMSGPIATLTTERYEEVMRLNATSLQHESYFTAVRLAEPSMEDKAT